MKKIISYLLLVGMISPVNAGLITHNDYVAGQTITAAAQNANENAIVNEFNGNIEAVNIKSGTIVAANLSAAVQGSFVPTGTVFQFAGAAAPTGYLLCDGSAVNRTTYATLFTAIGTTYGVGDNSTTFNVPDFRGRTAFGASSSAGFNYHVLGSTFGVTTSTLTTNELPAHGHSIAITDNGHHHPLWGANNSTGGTLVGLGDSNAHAIAAETFNSGNGYKQSLGGGEVIMDNTVTGISAVANNTGSGNGFSVVNPGIAVNYIIKY